LSAVVPAVSPAFVSAAGASAVNPMMPGTVPYFGR
jgi:hypothetical protein